jgi:hypothetical protein
MFNSFRIGTYEHDNEISSSGKFGEIIDYMNGYEILKMSSASWN